MSERPNKPVSNPRNTAVIIGIGSILAVVVDLFVLGGYKYMRPQKHVYPDPAIYTSTQDENVDYVPVGELALRMKRADDERNAEIERLAAAYPEPDVDGQIMPDVYVEEDALADVPEEDITVELVQEEAPKAPLVKVAPEVKRPKALSPAPNRWKKYAAPFDAAEGMAKIVIIIDDLGLSRRRSEAIVALDGPLTLAYLPYAPGLDGQTVAARGAGHELLIHTPMEPMSDTADPGPLALLESMSGRDMDAALEDMFGSFEGYIGINNHMGSRLTQNTKAMARVMKALRKRGLIFVDSRTAGGSVAAEQAQLHGLRYATRDVFLDHEETPEFVRGALAKAEAIAKRDGVAIAIGHPKDVTIEALEEWIPTLAAKGIVLAPVSAVLN